MSVKFYKHVLIICTFLLFIGANVPVRSQAVTIKSYYLNTITQAGTPIYYCINILSDTLEGISPTGKSFSYNAFPMPTNDPATDPPGIVNERIAGILTGRAFIDLTVMPANFELTYHTIDRRWPVIIDSPDIVTLDPFAGPICTNSPVFALSGGSPAGGYYTVNGIVATTFNPAASGPGTFYVYYLTGTGECLASSPVQAITVNPAPDVTIAFIPNVCLNTPPFTLTQGTPVGGTYGGPGVVGGVFYPATAGAGTHTISYTYSDGVCTGTAYRSITVSAIPVASFTGFEIDQVYCDIDPSDLLTGTPVGGTFTGNGITNVGAGLANFNPSTSGLGLHPITYSYTNASGCTNTYTVILRVGTLLTITGLDPVYCKSDPIATFNYNPPGGTFNAVAGLTDNIDGTGTFNPAIPAPGTYNIIYTYNDIWGCVNILTQPVEVAAIPFVNFVGLSATYCKNDPAVVLTGNHSPLGTFIGPGITDNGNGTATFNPALVPAGGPYNITYAYSDPVTGCGDSKTLTTSVLPLPTATISGSTTICIGGSANLTVTLSGTGLSFDFTYTDGNTDVTITGVSSPYTLVVTPSVSSVYTIESIEDSNGCSNTGTGTGTVNVNPLVVLTSSPRDTTLCPGSNITFAVTATGVGLTYQWRKNGLNIVGQTNSTLVLNSVTSADAASYDCIVSSSCGGPLASNTAVLTVLPVTTISTQPTDKVACENGNIVFSLNASGTGLTYQWRKNGIDMSNTANISGVTSPNLLINGISLSDAGMYACLVTGVCNSVVSNPVSLTVNENVVITLQPVNKSICPGNNVSFSISATGTGLSYQWTKDGSSLPGETNTSLFLGAVDAADAGLYRCIVTGTCGIVYSDIVTLAVYSNVSIAVQPVSVLSCIGSTTDFNISANGSNLTFRWRKDGVDLADGGTLSGSGTNHLSISGLVSGDQGTYTCRVSGSCGTETSSSAVLVVDEAAVITSNPSNVIVCPGDNVIYSVTATGTNLIYQWKRNGTDIAGATSNSFVILGAGVAHEATYNCIVLNSCGSVASSFVLLDLSETTVIAGQPASQIACEGDNKSFVVTATGTNLVYQWRKDGADLSDGGSISGSNLSSLLITGISLTDDGVYTCRVSGDCGILYTDPALLTVNSPVVITQQPLNQTVCPGDNVTFYIEATGTGLTYQWQKNGVNLPGETGNNLVLPLVTSSDAAVYRCILAGTCGTVFSNPATLTVNSAPSISVQPASSQLCSGTNATFSVQASGTGLSYQWRRNSVDLVNGGNISGATSNNLIVSSISSADAGVYSCRITATCGFISSTPANLTVYPLTTITVHPVMFVAVEGGNASFSVSAEGENLTYQWWRNGVVLSNGVKYSGVTTSILNITGVTETDEGSFQCIVTGTCGQEYSDPGLLTVNALTLIVTHPVALIEKCIGESITLDVVANGTNLTFQWKKDGTDLTDNANINGSNTPNLTINSSSPSDNGNYSCLVTGVEGMENSMPAQVIVYELTDVTLHPLNAVKCIGDNAIFVINAAGSDLTYQWKKNGINLADVGTISGSSTSILTITGLTPADAGTYLCYVTGECGYDNSNPASLEVNTITAIVLEPVAQIKCTGESVTFSVLATGGNLIYQWKKDGISLANAGNISGADSKDLTITNVTTSDIGAYSCYISGTCGSGNSMTATFMVNPEVEITSQPADTRKCQGDDAYFKVVASGSSLIYEWRRNGVALVEGGRITGTATELLQVNGLLSSDAGLYQCYITGDCGTFISDPATLIVDGNVQIVTSPTGKNKCLEESATFTVLATGSTLTYQWRKDGVDLSDDLRITGSLTETLNLVNIAASDAGIYTCFVSGICNSLTSAIASLIVTPSTSMVIQPISRTVTEGTAVTFTISASGENLIYQWQRNGVSLSDNAVRTGTNTEVLNLSTTVAGDAGTYTCIVTGTCGTVISSPASLVVNLQTLIIVHPSDQTLCESSNAVFSVTASGSSLTYQWKRDGVNLTDQAGKIIGSSTQNITIADVEVSDEGVYTCVVTGGGGSVNSNTATLIVNLNTIINSQTEGNIVKCAGTNAYFLVDVTGESLTYAWEKNGLVLTDGGNISGSSSEILTLTSVTPADAGIYKCRITGTCGNVTSISSSLSVNLLPGPAGAISGDDQVCQGELAKSYEVPVITNADSYLWTMPYGATIISGTGTRFITVEYSSSALGGAISVHGVNSCGAGAESPALTVTVNPIPIANAGLDQTLCINSTNLNANVTAFGIWTRLSGPATIADIALSNTSVTGLGQGDNLFMWTVSENGCTKRDTVIVRNNMVFADAGTDHTICSLTSRMNANTPSVGTGNWSITAGGGVFSSINDPRANVINLSRGTNIIRWSINNGGCISYDEITIVNDLPSNSVAGTDTIILVDNYTLDGNDPVIGTGRWTLLSGSGNITDPNLFNTTVTSLGIGENIFQWVITNNLCYSQDEVKVINYSPTLTDAGPEQTLCTDKTILSGTKPNYGTGQWSVVAGSGTFLDPYKYDTEVINIGKGQNVFRWTVYEYQVTFDDVIITNNSPSTSNAGIDQRLCLDNSRLAGNSPIIGTGHWTVIGGSGIVTNTDLYNSTVTNLGSGSNTFRWTITNGTCASYDEVIVSNDQPTQAEAGVDQIICADSVNLYQNTPTIGVGEWSVVQGSAFFSGNKAFNLARGENLLKWTIINNGCSDSDTVMITSNKPTTSFTGEDRSICVDSIYLPGNAPTYGTGIWTILSGSATFDNVSDPKSKVTDLAPGQNRFRWTITYNGCISYSEVFINYNYIESDAGSDQTLCQSNALLSANDPGIGVGQWSVVGGSGSANFLNPDQSNTEVTNLDKGTNTLRWTITNSGCVSFNDVIITNNLPSAAYAGSDRSVCGEDIFLNANKPTVGSGEWIVLSGSATIENTSLFNSGISNLSIGQNVLRWSVTNQNCILSDEVIISNNQPPNIEAGPSQYNCSNSAQLYASDPVGGTGRWSISQGSATFADNTLFNTMVNNLDKGENRLVWTVTLSGCSNSDTVVIVNNLPSTPSAGPDQDLCSDNVFMAANQPVIGTSKWIVVSGSAEFTDLKLPNTNVTKLGNGQNILRWTITNGSCILYDEVIINNSLPTVAYAGEDRGVCNTTATLLATAPVSGTGAWSVVSGYGIFTNPNNHDSQINSLGFGPNTLRWTTENGRCRTSDDVIITNNLADVYAGPDQVVYDPTVKLVGNKPARGEGQWIVLAGLGTVESPTAFETNVTGLGGGANTFTWTINNEGCIASDDVVITHKVLPTVDFDPLPGSGCPPLTISFINNSIGGAPFRWDFGDGNTSTATNTDHTYYIPGNYTVRLTATGPDGITLHKDTVIVIRPIPVAQFEITPDTAYIPGNSVNFFNLSNNIDSLRWEFGDGTYSTEENPNHRYISPGSYNVTLQVWSGYQCFDSLVSYQAVYVERAGILRCPNAFTPNLTGSTGGQYNQNDFSNDVFHCFAEGIKEYHLEIYNRQGIILFSSSDINTGWDGYYKGRIVEEGVYVFKISGKYNNGETFTYVGNIAVII